MEDVQFEITEIRKDNTSTVTSEERCFYLDALNEYDRLLIIESIVTAIINVICSIIAITGNGIIINTFWKSTHLRSHSHLFLWCLACADFITGLVVQPCYGAHKIARVLGYSSTSCIFRLIMETVAWFSAAVSCATFASISGERFLALYYHLRYREVVTSKKIAIFILYLWAITAVLSFSRFAVSNIRPFLSASVCGIMASLLTLLISYWKIFQLVRRHHRQIQDLAVVSSETSSLNLTKFKKSALNIGLIAILYMMAYVPFTCVLVAYLIYGFTRNVEASYDITRTLAFMASAWNPFLYCWKMSDVRVMVKSIFRPEGTSTNASA